MRKEPPPEHRFKKDISGNPNGRPKKINTEALEQFLQTCLRALQKDPTAKSKLTHIQKILDERN